MLSVTLAEVGRLTMPVSLYMYLCIPLRLTSILSVIQTLHQYMLLSKSTILKMLMLAYITTAL